MYHFRYTTDNISCACYRRSNNLYMHAKITFFAREMYDLLFDCFVNWMHINCFPGYNRQSLCVLSHTAYVSSHRIHSFDHIAIIVSLAECAKFQHVVE